MNDNINISTMNLQDLENIKDILETDFDDFWNYNILKKELESPISKYFVIKDNTQIIGFAGLTIVLDEADITNIVIKKSHRGNGFSNLLMENIILFCKNSGLTKINLEVCSSNILAINLYKKFGFEQVGLRKNYYKNGDGLLFTKHLILA